MKKGLFSKFMVFLIIVLNIWFTLKVFDVVEATSVEPSSLVMSWFAFTTGELWMLSSIKKAKTRYSVEEEYEESEEV